MAYPTASTTPTMSGSYIPEVWSGKLLEKFYPSTVFGSIANTDYEGEITDSGDKVNVRVIPNIAIHEYIKGQQLVVDTPEGDMVVLLIDKGFYFNVAINAVDKKQSDINFMNKWGEDAAQQLKVQHDRKILGSIYVDAAPDNTGATAGKVSGNVNLGTTGAPLVLGKEEGTGVDAIVDKIVECGQVLDEQDRPSENRWMVLPAWAGTKIKTSWLKDASMTGDGKSMLLNGRIGMIDRFELFLSNGLPMVTDGGKNCVHMPFGHKSALTYASQFVNNEILPNPNDFGQLMRGLQVFGYEVINPDSMGVMYGYAG